MRLEFFFYFELNYLEKSFEMHFKNKNNDRTNEKKNNREN